MSALAVSFFYYNQGGENIKDYREIIRKLELLWPDILL
jgi:hypothetical protein